MFCDSGWEVLCFVTVAEKCYVLWQWLRSVVFCDIDWEVLCFVTVTEKCCVLWQWLRSVVFCDSGLELLCFTKSLITNFTITPLFICKLSLTFVISFDFQLLLPYSCILYVFIVFLFALQFCHVCYYSSVTNSFSFSITFAITNFDIQNTYFLCLFMCPCYVTCNFYFLRAIFPYL